MLSLPLACLTLQPIIYFSLSEAFFKDVEKLPVHFSVGYFLDDQQTAHVTEKQTKNVCAKGWKERDPPKSCSYGPDLLPGQVQVGARGCKLTFSNTISCEETKLAIDGTLFQGDFRWKPKMARRVGRVGRPGLRCKGGGCCCGCSSRSVWKSQGLQFLRGPNFGGLSLLSDSTCNAITNFGT